MFSKSEMVVYKGRVCKIKDIKQKYINNMNYYILEPLDDPSLIIDVPIDNNNVRKLMSKNEVEKLIARISDIPILDSDDKNMEREYRELLKSEKHENLIKIIKTSYLRNKDRLDQQKKKSDIDSHFFQKAEALLYNELSLVLGMSYEDTKKYVIDQVTHQREGKK